MVSNNLNYAVTLDGSNESGRLVVRLSKSVGWLVGRLSVAGEAVSIVWWLLLVVDAVCSDVVICCNVSRRCFNSLTTVCLNALAAVASFCELLLQDTA